MNLFFDVKNNAESNTRTETSSRIVIFHANRIQYIWLHMRDIKLHSWAPVLDFLSFCQPLEWNCV